MGRFRMRLASSPSEKLRQIYKGHACEYQKRCEIRVDLVYAREWGQQ